MLVAFCFLLPTLHTMSNRPCQKLIPHHLKAEFHKRFARKEQRLEMSCTMHTSMIPINHI